MTVAKPFNTRSRRFKIGDTVTDADNLSPHALDDLKARGFIVGDDVKPETAKPKRR